MLSKDGIQDYLYHKVDEWLETVDLSTYETPMEAEQAFKEWLWGISHGC